MNPCSILCNIPSKITSRFILYAVKVANPSVSENIWLYVQISRLKKASLFYIPSRDSLGFLFCVLFRSNRIIQASKESWLIRTLWCPFITKLHRPVKGMLILNRNIYWKYLWVLIFLHWPFYRLFGDSLLDNTLKHVLTAMTIIQWT